MDGEHHQHHPVWVVDRKYIFKGVYKPPKLGGAGSCSLLVVGSWPDVKRIQRLFENSHLRGFYMYHPENLGSVPTH